MGNIDNWTIVVIIALILAAIVFIRFTIMRKKGQELDISRQDLAISLGLKYEHNPTHDSSERIHWRIGGTVRGREVKLESISLPRIPGDRYVQKMQRLSAFCNLPENVNVVVYILTSSDKTEDGVYTFPHPRETGKRICVRVKGDFNPKIITGTDIVEVMASKGLIARLDIEDSWMSLFYEFGSEKMNLAPQFIKGAISALVDFANKAEKQK